MLLPSSRFTSKLERVVGDKLTDFMAFQAILETKAQVITKAKDLLYEITPVVRGETYNTSDKSYTYLSVNVYRFTYHTRKYYRIRQIHKQTFARKTKRINSDLKYDDWFIVKVKKCNREQQDVLENF